MVFGNFGKIRRANIVFHNTTFPGAIFHYNCPSLKQFPSHPISFQYRFVMAIIWWKLTHLLGTRRNHQHTYIVKPVFHQRLLSREPIFSFVLMQLVPNGSSRKLKDNEKYSLRATKIASGKPALKSLVATMHGSKVILVGTMCDQNYSNFFPDPV